MCIYYKDQLGLNYQKQEHIIPAALGGIKTLARGVVSDEFNREIAELEREYMRDSLFAGFSRIVQGPGVRGSLSSHRQVRSKIHVLVNKSDPSDLTLGYIQKGIPYQLVQLRYNIQTKDVQVQFPNSPVIDVSATFNELKEICRMVRNSKVTELFSDQIPPEVLLFGYLQEAKGPRLFFASNADAEFKFEPEILEEFAEKLFIDPAKGISNSNPVISNTTAVFKVDYHRVHAKMAFNYLAHLYGAEFVNNTCFDAIRNWIASGGENDFVGLNQEKDAAIQQIVEILPPAAHAVLICHDRDHVFAYVIVYRHWVNFIVLTRNAPSMPPGMMQGLICDWKNRIEFSLSELWNIIQPNILHN